MIENVRNSLHAPGLSIIICVFDTKPEYLEECLISIYGEELDNTEVIVVDDGSRIDYSHLISDYSPKYIRTENRGLLSARITGIKASHGEYVAFVDADDMVTSRYHKPMLEAALACGCDMVIGEWAYFTDKGIRVHECDLHTRVLKSSHCSSRHNKRCYASTDDTSASRGTELGMRVIEGDSLLTRLTDTGGADHTYYVMWNKIFRRSLLEKSVSELERIGADKQGLTYGEDVLFSYFNYKYSGCILPFSYGLYLYRIHPSQSVGEASLTGMEKQIKSMGYIFDILMHDTKDLLVSQGIARWREFTASVQYLKARSSGYHKLYPLIVSRLGDARPRRVRRYCAYARREAAGRNFNSIEASLREICDTGSGVEVFYEKKCRYLKRFISSYNALLCGSPISCHRVITVAKRQLSLSDMLVSSHLISVIGARLLPHGSRLRAFVKSHVAL